MQRQQQNNKAKIGNKKEEGRVLEEEDKADDEK